MAQQRVDADALFHRVGITFAVYGEQEGTERLIHSLDVTQRIATGERHCRLGVGRDYFDAAPVRGVRRDGGREQLEVAVTVVPGMP